MPDGGREESYSMLPRKANRRVARLMTVFHTTHKTHKTDFSDFSDLIVAIVFDQLFSRKAMRPVGEG